MRKSNYAYKYDSCSYRISGSEYYLLLVWTIFQLHSCLIALGTYSNILDSESVTGFDLLVLAVTVLACIWIIGGSIQSYRESDDSYKKYWVIFVISFGFGSLFVLSGSDTWALLSAFGSCVAFFSGSYTFYGFTKSRSDNIYVAISRAIIKLSIGILLVFLLFYSYIIIGV